MGILVHVLWHDLVLQKRSFFYPATAVSTLMICAFVLLLPMDPSPRLLAFFVFMDPATVGLSFVGAMVLVEKSQRTLTALGVTPLPTRTYVGSKAASLTLVTFAASLIVVLVGTRGSFDAVRLVVALTLSSTVAVLLGLVCVAGVRSMNQLVVRLLWLTSLLYLPLLVHFGVVDGVVADVIGLIPSWPMLLAIEASLAPEAVATALQAFALSYLALWAVVLWVGTVRGFDRAILTEGK